jgi:hypothetical protein
MALVPGEQAPRLRQRAEMLRVELAGDGERCGDRRGRSRLRRAGRSRGAPRQAAGGGRSSRAGRPRRTGAERLGLGGGEQGIAAAEKRLVGAEEIEAGLGVGERHRHRVGRAVLAPPVDAVAGEAEERGLGFRPAGRRRNAAWTPGKRSSRGWGGRSGSSPTSLSLALRLVCNRLAVPQTGPGHAASPSKRATTWTCSWRTMLPSAATFSLSQPVTVAAPPRPR